MNRPAAIPRPGKEVIRGAFFGFSEPKLVFFLHASPLFVRDRRKNVPAALEQQSHLDNENEKTQKELDTNSNGHQRWSQSDLGASIGTALGLSCVRGLGACSAHRPWITTRMPTLIAGQKQNGRKCGNLWGRPAENITCGVTCGSFCCFSVALFQASAAYLNKNMI